MPRQLLYSRFAQVIFLQRLSPLVTDPPMKMYPPWGPRPSSQSTNQVELHLSVTNLHRYRTRRMRRSQLPTPCPLCKEIQWPLCPPGKVDVLAASPIKPPLGHPAHRSCESCKRAIDCNIDHLTSSSCHIPFHHSCSGLTSDAAATALARNSWICRRCTTTPPQLRQGQLQTNRFVSDPANRVSQSALRIPQWNADGHSPKGHEL